MENPAWYTAYTPYQPEISQGRLEALLNFQTMVAELTGLPTSGASLLDEGTAAAEAMALSRRVGKVKKGVFLVDADTLPQTVAVIETRAEPTGVEVVVADLSEGIPAEIAERGVFGVLLQYPGASGAVRAIEPVIKAHVDGANLNALVGLAKPGKFGGDVSHLNLHKTFCIPHGGGGPGVGPVGVRAHLAPYLPNHPLQPSAGPETGVGPISAAPWGSAGILPICVGVRPSDGRRGPQAGHAGRGAGRELHRQAPGAALPDPVQRPGRTGRARVHRGPAPDLQGDRRLHRRRRQAPDRLRLPLADHVVPRGRHADDRADRERGPRGARPVLRHHDRDPRRDREGRLGGVERDDNPLANAPHTAAALGGDWEHGYSREEAVFPTGVSAADKYWPPVRRIDGAFGDRNLVCSCPPLDEYDN
ncbi:glycine dehydrogenase (decarboxylating) [Streptomyces badius]